MKSVLLNQPGRLFALALLCLAFTGRAEIAAPEADVTPRPAKPAELAPGPNDGRIAYVAARMLDQNHYRELDFNDAISESFFWSYIKSLDPQRVHFTQEDIAGWENYIHRLDNLTLDQGRQADTRPGIEIFKRFRERLEQRVVFADEMLKDAKNFDFTADETVLLNRKNEPFPADLAAARQLWRERLRYEYLQEKLARFGKSNQTRGGGNQAAPGPEAGETNAPPATVKDKTPAEEIADVLSRRYHRNLKFFADWNSDDVLQLYLTALAQVYDPHSDYMSASASENFAIGMSLSLFGIGAELRSVDGYCTITRLMPGGPAFKSGKLKEKDRIVAVAQGDGPWVDVVEMHLNKAVQLIRGAKGSEVRLMIVPPNDTTARREISMTRDEIPLEDQRAKARIIDLPDAAGKSVRLGVIDLPSFYATVDLNNSRNGSEVRSTTADVSRLLQKLMAEKVSGVILDLRRNGGGSLEECVNLTGLFIKSGPVVQVRGRDSGRVFVDEDRDGGKVLYDGPLIVLTSRFSASASEILAGALQDYGRALVVGDASTHGKGTVQNLNRLAPWVRPATPEATNDPGTLKLTIRKFYRPGGASTQLRGVLPDIVMPSIFNYSKDIGEAAHETALEYDTIPGVRFERMDRISPYLQELLDRSTTRVATNQDFIYIREDIEKFRRQQKENSISLNEARRLQEKEEDDARQKARDQERLARPESVETVYELTLKNVDLPGLPAPVEKTNRPIAQLSVPLGGGDTNSLAVSRASTSTGDTSLELDPELEAEEKPPDIDVVLNEGKSIMLDYLSLLGRRLVTSNRRD